MLAALLAEYFPFIQDWIIAPEWSEVNTQTSTSKSPDFTIFKIKTGPFDVLHDSLSYPYLIAEVKSLDNSISWKRLIEGQVRLQAYALGGPERRRVKVICLKGFEISFFDYQYFFPEGEEPFINFMPLNLHNYSEEQLNMINVKVVKEEGRIVVIRWKLDNEEHHIHIHEMFDHLSNYP